jgi:hypothetical protein
MVGVVDPYCVAGAGQQLMLGVGKLREEPLGDVGAAEGVLLTPQEVGRRVDPAQQVGGAAAPAHPARGTGR